MAPVSMEQLSGLKGTRTKRCVEIKRLLTEDLDARSHGMIFQHECLDELLPHHPAAAEKGIGMHVGYLTRPSEFGGNSVLYVVDGKGIERSISREAAIRGWLGLKVRENPTILAEAMRNAVWDKARKRYEFLVDHNECGHEGAYHIDHVGIPFVGIKNNYIEKYGVPDVVHRSRGLSELVDPEPWIEYHDCVARFRRVCAKCNMKAGAKPH